VVGPHTALLAGLTQLRAALRGAGSDLVVRVGPPERVIAQLACSTGASRIVMEREEESRWLEAGHRVAQQLEAQAGEEGCTPARITTWQAPLWPKAGFNPNFKAWLRSRGKAPLQPLPAPAKLPPLPAGVDPGELPSLQALQCMLAADVGAAQAGRAAPHSAAEEAALASASAAAEGDVWAARAAGHAGVLRALLAEPDTQPQAAAAAQLMSLLMQQERAADTVLGSTSLLSAADVLRGC
jgi:hypothetical protein